jgi:phosphate transport system protein
VRDAYHQELDELHDGLVALSTQVSESITAAVTALKTQDITLTEPVISIDGRVPADAVRLDEKAISLLARQQPVAHDLRFVVSTLRISSSLARMNDLASHLAVLVRAAYPDTIAPEPLLADLVQMGELDVTSAGLLTDLLRSLNPENLATIQDLESKVDVLHAEILAAVRTGSWEKATLKTVNATLASRYLERFADHAVICASMVRFVATGELAGGKQARASETFATS